MKKILLACLALALGLAASAQSKIVTESITSLNLGSEIKYNVYLPDGYDSARQYPVIYLLHGLYGTYRDWDSAGHMKEITDELIGSGELIPVVIVMPNAGDPDVHHIQNGYFNVTDWPYEDFFFQELMPAVESAYNCGGSKGQRALMGLSMGGGGSVVYAQRHPELFSSSYGMSAWLDSQGRADRESLPKDDKLYIVNESVKAHSALAFVDEADAEVLEQLKSIRWFLDCGDDDHLMMLSVDLYRKMRAAGIPCELRIRNGSHNWEYWRSALRSALPFASRNFR